MTRPDLALEQDADAAPRPPCLPASPVRRSPNVQREHELAGLREELVATRHWLAVAQAGREAAVRSAYRDGFVGGLLVGLGAGILVLLMWL